jgi:hypothetical protein
MKICSPHKSRIKDYLADAGIDPRRDEYSYFQAESLILANAITHDGALAFAPPTVCPLCELTIPQAMKWMKQCALSIKHERETPNAE